MLISIQVSLMPCYKRQLNLTMECGLRSMMKLHKSTALPRRKKRPSTLSGETSRSKWLFDQKVDPLNDVNRYTFFLEADSGTNEYGKKPVLIIRFADKETEAFINWDTYLGNDTDNYKYDSKICHDKS